MDKENIPRQQEAFVMENVVSAAKAVHAESDKKEAGTLQSAFEEFRKKRAAQLKGKTLKKKQQRPDREELRKRFLEQVKKYFGIPYHRKYHQEESSEFYGAPLYLDCCGLVRKVLRDLKDDFGFVIGPWNQAYQFDTLPIDLEGPEKMKPGDLVFISGTYFRGGKPQKHDMVHVEVWLGDGEKTIGARHQRGVVQVHDSYKFVSKTYHSMKYYFRSIDTWLDGVCKSICDEHPWIVEEKKLGSKSIFVDQTQQDEDAD